MPTIQILVEIDFRHAKSVPPALVQEAMAGAIAGIRLKMPMGVLLYDAEDSEPIRAAVMDAATFSAVLDRMANG